MKFRFITLLLLCSLAVSIAAQQLSYPTERVNGFLVYRYPVEKSIGLYRISKIFEVSVNDIVAWNPQLLERGPQEAEILLIPVAGVPREEPVTTQTTTLATDTAATDTIDPLAYLPHYRIDLIMPFHVGNDAPSAQEERLTEFYRGVVMALYDIPTEDSIFVNLHVHNSKSDTAAIAKLLEDSTLYGTNGIIGPFYTPQIQLLSPWIKENRIPTILPVSNDASYLNDNPWLMQYNTTPEQETKAVTEYLLSADQRINCIFIEDSTTEESTRNMRRALVENNIACTSIQSSAVLHDSLIYAVRTGAENIVFFPTGKFQRNKAYVSKIETLSTWHKMAVYGVFSWLKEQINVPLIYTSTFVTEQEADMTAYNETWEKYFHIPHTISYPRYDLLGYDITRKLIGLLIDKRYPGMQSDIDFEPYTDGGAMINSHIEVLRTE